MTSTIRWASFAALLLGLLTACATGNEQPVRLKESGLNSAFRYSGMAYPEYVAHMRRVIGQVRRDLTPANRERILDWNSPYILEPDPAKCPAPKAGRHRAGVLLIHGLTDSPFVLKDIAAHLHRKCFLVYGLLLPGHGTVPGDLLRVTAEEWVKATDYGLAALRPRVERLYAGGFSTGGALLVNAVFQGTELDGLFLFAPALGLEAAAALSPAAANVKPWLDVANDEDPAKYESFPTNAAAQIYNLVHALSFKINRDPFKVPLFVAVSEDDQTIDPQAVVEFFARVGDGPSRILLYGKGGARRNVRFLPIVSTRPAEGILNMGHLSLTASPDNPHYGRNGDYRNCLHYGSDPARWKQCKEGKLPAGEKTPENVKRGVVRLTYNPGYAHMLQELDAFVARVDATQPKN